MLDTKSEFDTKAFRVSNEPSFKGGMGVIFISLNFTSTLNLPYPSEIVHLLISLVSFPYQEFSNL